jgi:two-component system NtrC family response regulator
MDGVILIIDDDPSIVASLTLLLKQAGYPSRGITTPGRALEELGNGTVSLVLQDMNFSRSTTGDEGISLLRKIKTANPVVPVILMTAWGSIALAVQGMKAGAADFITKPWTNEELLHSIRTTLGLAGISRDTASPPLTREELDARYDFAGIVGRDPKLLQLLGIAGKVSATDATVLITGESGTGKELIAEAIHKNSARAGRPFVKVNLGGVSQSLFESEMFGHVRGAFTDAKENRRGRFEIADGGTIFLDEIGDLDGSCQAKLLRVLQDRTYEVLGSSETRSVNVRVISATNADLAGMIARSEFREDLLYRLNLIALHVPALRERRDDIPILARHFLASMAAVYRRTGLTIDDKALEWLRQLPWLGNIRQLKHTVERAVMMAPKDVLETGDFALPARMDASGLAKNGLPAAGTMTLEEMEQAMIEMSMKEFKGNISRVAESLGLSRAALYRRLEKFGIPS